MSALEATNALLSAQLKEQSALLSEKEEEEAGAESVHLNDVQDALVEQVRPLACQHAVAHAPMLL